MISWAAMTLRARDGASSPLNSWGLTIEPVATSTLAMSTYWNKSSGFWLGSRLSFLTVASGLTGTKESEWGFPAAC